MKAIIDQIRNAYDTGDEDKANNLKRKLPSFIFMVGDMKKSKNSSGVEDYWRTDENVTKLNGLVMLDFDHVGEQTLPRPLPAGRGAICWDRGRSLRNGRRNIPNYSLPPHRGTREGLSSSSMLRRKVTDCVWCSRHTAIGLPASKHSRNALQKSSACHWTRSARIPLECPSPARRRIYFT